MYRGRGVPFALLAEAMLDPGLLVSQQATTRYVLLARQRCDGCVTIGSNRMYGGVRCVWWVGSLF